MSAITFDAQTAVSELRRWIAQFDSVLVAYSGGVDSAVVMAAARAELGDRAIACIGVSPSYPEREMREAVRVAEAVGMTCRLINTEEYLDEKYAANPTNRCYYCKTELYNRLTTVAKTEGWKVILDGNNASDVGDDRPGHVAATEHGVRSPLQELGYDKAQVREIAKALGLGVWDKPAMACLSSRVPHGTPIVPDLLRKIEKAEDVLVALGFKQFRVRHHATVARIELPAEMLARAVELREPIVAGIKAVGYKHVTLDLGGFRKED